ncbi:MAG: methionine synthase [Candidatus Hodarchaeota archaeon]
MKILGAPLGSCVHVAGVLNFLNLAEEVGYKTDFMGPANSIDAIIIQVKELDPHVIALSYRLSPESVLPLLNKLKTKIESSAELRSKIWIFGGTSPVAKVAQKTGIFTKIFDGETTSDDAFDYLRGIETEKAKEEDFPQNLLERLAYQRPFPLLRAHFGLPSLEDTLEGVEQIAKARCIDIISIGPDQNFQECFFRPEEMSDEEGAGGVPIRSREDLKELYTRSRTGNFPLLRCYSGTRDLLKIAQLLHETIHNTWSATPLMWYNELDGRSKRALEAAIFENQENMRWHGQMGIPLESNESHHWSLRDAPDSIAVAMAYLAAYNAKMMGVKTYIAQFMFNTPMLSSPRMDLAKMLAKVELIESLHDNKFLSFRQVRTGLPSFPANPDMATGQLASSIQTAMHLKPGIVHIVSYCEADHAATAQDIIKSSLITKKVISNCLMGVPDISKDSVLLERKLELKNEATTLIKAIIALGSDMGSENPLINPKVLTQAVKVGLLDTPHFRGHKVAQGRIKTRMINGACYSIDPNTRKPITEAERLSRMLKLPSLNGIVVPIK